MANTTNETVHLRHETRFPIGGPMYLTVSVFRGAPIAHIRKFKTVLCTFNYDQKSIVPTRDGVTVSLEQLKTLYMSLPLAISDLEQRAAELSLEPTTPAADPWLQGFQCMPEEWKQGEGCTSNGEAFPQPCKTPMKRKRAGNAQ